MKIQKLYHYSNEKYDILKTREAQGIKDNDRQKRNKDYNKHISFFFEPVPLDIIGTIFKNTDNNFWIAGNWIYQYEVYIEDLPTFRYEIVESPLCVDLFYNTKYDHLSDEDWRDLRDRLRKESGEIGNNKDTFIKVASNMLGLSRQAYIDLPSRPNWKKVSELYAATVPHVMLYPENGLIKYRNVKTVLIEDKPMKIAKESFSVNFLKSW